jgi:transcriptional regulator with XRE-family HTH domain
MNKVEKRYENEIVLFGRCLKKIRESKGLSQLDIEIKSGLNRTEISRIENGQKNIEFFTIVKLAFAFDIELKELFNFVDNE